ncbi:MAG: phosphatase PAP2 family protein [Candidatus Aenigmarchaeota archaeon]|nr:phosphatase PAP2 family protein [Candidatus Aenigmarchaeota archaeon]
MALDVAMQNMINFFVTDILHNVLQLDANVFLFINHSLVNPVFDAILPFTHNLPYILFAVSVAYFFLRNERKLSLLLAIGIIISLVAVTLIKFSVDRPRPFEVYDDVRVLADADNSPSFPSNHVQTSFLVGTIVGRFHPYIGIFIYFLSAVVALGRVYTGVHYPTDVIAGALIGILIGWVVLRFLSDVKIVRAFVKRELKKYVR